LGDRTQAAPRLDDPAIEQRITQLLSQMTLEEKIGQTVHYADSSTGPGAPHADYDVSYRFHCAHADQLVWIDIRLFEQAVLLFERVRTRGLDVELATNLASARSILDSAMTR